MCGHRSSYIQMYMSFLHSVKLQDCGRTSDEKWTIIDNFNNTHTNHRNTQQETTAATQQETNKNRHFTKQKYQTNTEQLGEREKKGPYQLICRAK